MERSIIDKCMTDDQKRLTLIRIEAHRGENRPPLLLRAFGTY